MANVIRHKRGTSDPVAGDFSDTAELLINTTDGGLFTKTDGGSVVEIGSGAGGGLTEFVESQDTASPNATIPVDALTATDASYTDIDVALVAKGVGATLAQVPDGTTAGGNKRGNYAVDWQKVRSGATSVASGNRAVICGGENNAATGQYSAIAGGRNNTASGIYSAVGGQNSTSTNSQSVCFGYGSDATGYISACLGGYINDATGQYSGVFSGYNNDASGSYSVCVGGNNNNATGVYSACLGGRLNRADAEASSVVGGVSGDTRATIGKHVTPASNNPISSTQGHSQAATLVLGRETTDVTATVLASNTSTPGSTNQLFLDNNTAYYFKGSLIAGVTGAGDTRAWTFEGAIKRGASAATTAIVGTVVLNTIAYDSGAAAWDVAITANTTSGCLKVEVTGAAATTIRWVAKIETTEMGF